MAQDPGRGMAIASLILGIASIPLAFIYVGIATAIVGLVLGIMAKKKQSEAGFPTGMAVAGMVCSIITLALSIVVSILCTATLCAASNLISDYGSWY